MNSFATNVTDHGPFLIYLFSFEIAFIDLITCCLLILGSQYTIPAMKLVGGAFRTTLALKHQYITEVNDQVVKPLDDFLKTDLKEFKEAKKTFDKALEKYESTLAKYNGQSRQKEPSALREEAFQLYDTRKAYIQAAMACSMLCIKFQDSLDQLVLGIVRSCLHIYPARFPELLDRVI